MISPTKLALAALAMTIPVTQASAERIFGLTASNQIVTFDSLHPATITSTAAISGLSASERLTGIDLRASNKTLYSVGKSGAVYTLIGNASSGYVATAVGNVGVTILGGRYGVDFNPVSDQLRFISDIDQNLRINPDTGVATVDGAIKGPGGSNLNLVGAAYTGNHVGALTTTLYGIDALTSSLVRSTNPDAGIFTNLNVGGTTFLSLGFNVGAEGGVGFDISGSSGLAYLSRGTGLYRVDLTSGSAKLLGQPGFLTGITAGSVPEPSVWIMALVGFGLIGATTRNKRRLHSVAV